MDNYARQPLGGFRFQPYAKTLRFVGVDLTGATFRMQARLVANTPGAPLFDLQTVTTAAAQGVRLISVETIDGVKVSSVGIRINKTTMENLPFTGELGDDSSFAYDLQVNTAGGLPQVWLAGEFWALAAVTGADNAAASLSAGYASRSRPSLAAGSSSFQIGDTIISVTMSGAQGPAGNQGRPGTGTVDQDLRDRIVDLGATTAIAGNVTLDATAYGRAFEASGNGACNVVLPASDGTAVGKAVSFFVPTTFGKLLAITTPEAGGGIDNAAELILWAGESVSLRWDGGTWRRVFGVGRSFFGKIKTGAAMAIPADGAAHQLLLTVATGDRSGFNLAVDPASKCFRAPRTGNYVFDYAGPITANADADVRAFLQTAALTGEPDENAVDIAYHKTANGRTWQKLTYSVTLNKGQSVAAFVRIVGQIAGMVENAGSVIVPTLSYREVL
jgi:hypothetical protein